MLRFKKPLLLALYSFLAHAGIAQVNCINQDFNTPGTATSSIGQSFTINGCSGGYFFSIDIEKNSTDVFNGTLTLYNGQSDNPADQLYEQTGITLSGTGFQTIELGGGSGSLAFSNGAQYTFIFSGYSGSMPVEVSGTNNYPAGQMYAGTAFDAANDLSFRINTVPYDPLPVEMTYFEGEPSDGGVMLQWSTASELNNKGFEIQYSDDGADFETVAWVAGKGSTTEAQTYSYMHNPLPGRHYYRLKQVDYDGKYDFSRLVMVNTANTDYVVYPNPTSGVVSILSHTPIVGHLRVINSVGQVIMDEEITASPKVDLSDQPDGMYKIEIYTDQKIFEQKVQKK